MFNKILMLDTEYTDLRVDSARVWEIGAVYVPDPSETFEVCRVFNNFTGMSPEHWEDSTAQWAVDTYSPEVLKVHEEIGYEESLLGEDTLVRDFHGWVKSLDLENCLVIANHPEADIALLNRKFAERALKAPWHYRNVQDLQSIIWGLVRYNPTIFENLKEDSKVSHRALEDCYQQLHWLVRAFRHAGVVQ